MRKILTAAAVVLTLGIVMTGCYVNQTDLFASDRLAPGAPTERAPSLSTIAYGPEVNQHLNVYLPSTPAIGVIMWLHGGGWCCGEQVNVDPLILDTIDLGYAVVSVDYRRAPEFHLDALASDVDRAVRFVKSKRAEWGIAAGKLVIGGGSAGGHMALLQATSAGSFVAPDLPANLRAIDSHVDAAISFAGPTDLRPYIDGTIPDVVFSGQTLVEKLLGCSNRGTIDPATGRPFGPCTDLQVLRGSPLFWTVIDVMFGTKLPPVYLGYGDLDQLVPPDSQGEPIAYVWQDSAGFLATWLDRPTQGGHNLSFDLNRTAFQLWLRTFAAP